MNPYDLIKLILNNLVIVLLIPIVCIIIGMGLTGNTPKEFSTETNIYTGVASGSTLENQTGVGDRFRIESVFDNVLTIMQSRGVLEETGMLLLAQHLSTDSTSPRILSIDSRNHLNNILPKDVQQQLSVKGSLDKTFFKIKEFKEKDENNVVYKLINSNEYHYSINAIKKIKCSRIKSSDIIKIEYSNDDPGICKSTLMFFSRAFIKKYQKIKVGETGDIVMFFEKEVERVRLRLNESEKKLQEFRENNNVLDYTEQVRAITLKKEDMESEHHNEKMNLASAEAAVKYTEEQLETNKIIVTNSHEFLAKRKTLEELSAKLATSTLISNKDDKDATNTVKAIKSEMNKNLNEIYNSQYSTNAIHSKELIDTWFNNIIKVGQIKSRLKVFENRKEEYKTTYSEFSPVGSQLTKLEREVEIVEQEYLRAIESLNLAKLREQNTVMSTELHMVDEPLLPIYPNSSKRFLILIIAGILGFAFIMTILVVLELTDRSIKHPTRMSFLTNKKVLSAFPKLVKSKKIDFGLINERLIGKLVERTGLSEANHEQPMVWAFTSSYKSEGKSFVLEKVAEYLNGKNFACLKVFLDNTSSKSGNEIHLNNNDLIFNNQEIHEIIGLDVEDFLKYKIILIEVPGLLENEIPSSILKKCDLIFFIARANRVWNDADKELIHLTETRFNKELHLLLNGIKVQYLDQILGDVPRKRSFIRLFFRKIARMEFGTRRSI